jgi:hypothetical protein
MVICYVFGYLVFYGVWDILWSFGILFPFGTILRYIWQLHRLCRDQLELDNCRKSNGIFSEREKKNYILKALFKVLRDVNAGFTLLHWMTMYIHMYENVS